MIECYLGLGSNLRSPERQLRRALLALRCLPSTHVIAVANFYFNKAWGRKAQPDYCNTVVALRTSLKPHYFLAKCQEIEKRFGRIRRVRWGARTLDIDILLFGSQKIQSASLVVPHPLFHQREFVLIPLAEVLSSGNSV